MLKALARAEREVGSRWGFRKGLVQGIGPWQGPPAVGEGPVPSPRRTPAAAAHRRSLLDVLPASLSVWCGGQERSCLNVGGFGAPS